MKDFGVVGKIVEGNEGDKCNYPMRLDTYGCGCQHDCSYCYAKSLLDFRKLWDPKNPSVAPIQKISREVRKIPKDTVVRLGGMTDCFQPCESLHRITYKTIRLLEKHDLEYLIVTKSSMVADDLYMSIMDPEHAHIQITVTTLDDDLCRSYEHASPPSDRIKAIKKLQDAGYDVALRLSPFLPPYIDFNKLNGLGIKKILIEFLRANSWIEKWFNVDYSEYTINQSGYKHMPLKKKLEYIKRITGFEQMTVCEDETEAYDYWQSHFNYNKDDCCNLRRNNEA